MLRKSMNVFFSLFAVLQVYMLFQHYRCSFINKAYAHWDYHVTSWLINYAGGYVRRGLPGFVLHPLHERFHIDPALLVLPLGAACVLLLGGILVYLFVKRQLNWWILPTSFCIGGLGGINTDALVLLIAMATIWSFIIIHNNLLRFFVVNALSIIGIHVHEIFFLVTMPMIGILAMKDCRLGGNRLSRFVFILPSVCAFVSVCIFRGDTECASRIISSWMPVDDTSLLSEAAFTGVSIGYSAAMLMSRVAHSLFFETTFGLPNFVVFPFYMVAIAYVVCSVPCIGCRNIQFSMFLSIYVVQMASLLILIPVFVDFCRLFSFAAISTYMFALLVPFDKFNMNFSIFKQFDVKIHDSVGGGGFSFWQCPLSVLMQRPHLHSRSQERCGRLWIQHMGR